MPLSGGIRYVTSEMLGLTSTYKFPVLRHRRVRDMVRVTLVADATGKRIFIDMKHKVFESLPVWKLLVSNTMHALLAAPLAPYILALCAG